MTAGNTVQIDSHAVATLRYIRASMEAASALTVPGSAAIAVGVIGIVAAVLSSVPALQDEWLILWLAAAVVATVAGGALMANQGSPRLALGGAPLRKFALCELPALFAGAVMTAVHVHYGNPQAIPGTWLILYGCSLVSASAVTNRTIGLLGAAFVAFGLTALVLPDAFQIFMLGAGFGGLHIVFGLYMRRALHGNET